MKLNNLIKQLPLTNLSTSSHGKSCFPSSPSKPHHTCELCGIAMVVIWINDVEHIRCKRCCDTVFLKYWEAQWGRESSTQRNVFSNPIRTNNAVECWRNRVAHQCHCIRLNEWSFIMWAKTEQDNVRTKLIQILGGNSILNMLENQMRELRVTMHH